MGMFYLVEPFDPADEQCEWLESEGVKLPPGNKAGRNPTPAEVREVCDALTGFAVHYNISAGEKYWQAEVAGIKGPDRKRGTLLNIDRWGGSENRRYKISFEKGDPLLILQILHGLSQHCGPLLVVPDSDTPVVVWPEADVKKLVKVWG